MKDLKGGKDNQPYKFKWLVIPILIQAITVYFNWIKVIYIYFANLCLTLHFRILQGWPNTYTFTKAMCEEMLQEEGEGLPICVFRPAAGKHVQNIILYLKQKPLIL